MITVFSKQDCERCASFKQKLPLLGLVEGEDWQDFPVDDLEEMWALGREDEAIMAQSALAMSDGALPTIEFSDRMVMGYAAAIKAIKKEGKR